MEAMNVFASRLFPRENRFVSGHRACQGCGEALAVRMVHQLLGRNTMVASATGCMEIISSSYPDTAWSVPWLHVAFENAAAVASGIEVGLNILMEKGKLPKRRITVVGMGGDGGTSDIGLQALSGALERGHRMIYVCYDNEAYMNTGIQRSSATPFGASTTTSPAGKFSPGQQTWKKNLPMIAVAHRIPYVATACPSYPFDLADKVRRAAEAKGPAYIHMFASCPTGWRMNPELAVAIGRLAVDSQVFPLYEVVDGRLHLTHPVREPRPVKDYFAPQGRFRHLDEAAVARIERRVREEYQRLLERDGQILF
ncbi:MAG: pyruvate ferredoxin oxidoreductase [Myxococcales bacterium]|nr:pyruvate ferredoxin oxidoreductase [Myxococcales bacterium]